MKIGCSTLYKASNTPSVIEATKEIKKAGFDSAQIHYELISNYKPWKAYYDGIFPIETVLALKKLDFELTLHVPFSKLNYVHKNISLSREAINFTKDAIRQMENLGCREFVMHMARKPEDMNVKTALEIFAKRFNFFFEKLAKRGSTIFIENIESNLGSKTQEIEKALKLMPSTKLCLDIGHANINNMMDLLQKPIGHVHAHDNHALNDEHNVIGDGTINWKKIFDKLKVQKFDGTITLEPKSLKEGIASKKMIEKYWNS